MKQAGVVKFRGSIEDMNFYRTKNGFLARYKTGVSRERVKTDPKFKRTRENNAEFGMAAAGGALIRKSQATHLDQLGAFNLSARMLKLIMRIVRTDTTNPRGQRRMADGDFEMLEGFGFNEEAELERIAKFGYEAVLDQATGDAGVTYPEFVPTTELRYPEGATHYKLVCGASELDFAAGTYVSTAADSGWLVLDDTPVAAGSLMPNVTVGTVLPVLVLFGVMYAQEVNGVVYPLSDDTFNCLNVVKAGR